MCKNQLNFVDSKKVEEEEKINSMEIPTLENIISNEKQNEIMKQKIYNRGVPYVIIDSYPVYNDYAFWLNILQSSKSGNREFKTAILERVMIKNNNKYDKWFGYGYTSNLIYPEKDYIYEYYTFGIIGLLLLIGPYLLIFMKAIYLFVSNFKNYFYLDYILTYLPVGIGLFIGYFSGHVFFKSLSTYFLVFVIYVLIKKIFIDGDSYEKN